MQGFHPRGPGWSTRILRNCERVPCEERSKYKPVSVVDLTFVSEPTAEAPGKGRGPGLSAESGIMAQSGDSRHDPARRAARSGSAAGPLSLSQPQPSPSSHSASSNGWCSPGPSLAKRIRWVGPRPLTQRTVGASLDRQRPEHIPAVRLAASPDASSRRGVHGSQDSVALDRIDRGPGTLQRASLDPSFGRLPGFLSRRSGRNHHARGLGGPGLPADCNAGHPWLGVGQSHEAATEALQAGADGWRAREPIRRPEVSDDAK
jgi:hypothetical protein